MAPHFAEEIAVQTLCAIPNSMFLEHLPGSNLRDSEMLLSSYVLRDGYGLPPDKPGHGIEFNWQKLDDLLLDYRSS
jgi:L-alanine-DL-glutamate epimerase-like enolase superfamily enzyme